jgi:hypothetical protein
MMRNPWVDPRLGQVRAAAAKAYLLAHGWVLDPRSDDEMWVFTGPLADDGEPILQVLPTSEGMRAFPYRIEELIGALSILENRHPRDILEDMLNEKQSAAGSSKTNGTSAKSQQKPKRRERKS